MDPIAHSESVSVLTAQRGGLAPTAPAKMHPSEIALTLPAEILRLPYPPATRLILAEIVSLYTSNAGCCDASDPHFAARLTINKDTVSVAIKLLEKEGLLTKVVTPVQGGKYRTLTPNVAAIAAKAATNVYPDVPINTRRKFRRVQDRKSSLHTPEFPDSHAGISVLHTPEFPDPQTGNSGGNIPVVNTPDNFQVNPPTRAASAAAPAAESVSEELKAKNHRLAADAQASHTEGAATDVATRKRKPRPPVSPPELLPAGCPLADLLNPPGDAHRVQELAEPLTLAQAERLLADYPEPAVRDILCQMANWQPLLQKATSANLTCRNWLSKRAKTTQTTPVAHVFGNPTSGRRTTQTTQSGSARELLSEGIQYGPPLTGSIDDL